MMKTHLCWFRNDFRTRDNLALKAARAEGPVTAIYIATPGQWKAHFDAPVKLDFWRRNLLDLEKNLKLLGIPLLYFQVSDYLALPSLFQEILANGQVSSLHFNAEYPLNELRRDEEIKSLCEQSGVRVNVAHDQVLLQPGSILNNAGEPFKVFTPFSRKCRTMIYVPPTVTSIDAVDPDSGAMAISDKQCGLNEIDWPAADPAWEKRWPAGEKHAQKLLAKFCNKNIEAYKRLRDFPAIKGTSSLSPWLNAGVLSIRDCWRKAGVSQSGEGVETWKNELLWREFYRHIIFHYPHISQHKPFRLHLDQIPWRHDTNEFRSWCEGRTGIPIIDAAMRQLNQTGWMHNRLRMVTAMFLSKHLLIDWRWGEQYFMQHLVDGDFSANNGGWQWSASTGTDSVPYFRVFNPVTQSKRFDASGDFIRQYVPELKELDAKVIHQPGVFSPDNYPAPLIDLKFGRERALASFKL